MEWFTAPLDLVILRNWFFCLSESISGDFGHTCDHIGIEPLWQGFTFKKLQKRILLTALVGLGEGVSFI